MQSTVGHSPRGFTHVKQIVKLVGLCVQATFFIALAVASRLGTAALAAHQIVAQLWLLTSYVTDGFAVAGTVLGSRLSSQRHITVDKSATRYITIVSHFLLSIWSEHAQLPQRQALFRLGFLIWTAHTGRRVCPLTTCLLHRWYSGDADKPV